MSWIKISEQLPAPGEKVLVLVSNRQTSGGYPATAHFMGIQYEPGQWCRGIFRRQLCNRDMSNYIVSGLWKPAPVQAAS